MSKFTLLTIVNDLVMLDLADATQQESATCWEIEQFRREAKQVTGLEPFYKQL